MTREAVLREKLQEYDYMIIPTDNIINGKVKVCWEAKFGEKPLVFFGETMKGPRNDSRLFIRRKINGK